MAGSDASHVLDAVTLGPGWIVDVDPMDTL
jgi:hypothetical protein